MFKKLQSSPKISVYNSKYDPNYVDKCKEKKKLKGKEKNAKYFFHFCFSVFSNFPIFDFQISNFDFNAFFKSFTYSIINVEI